jgi:hypothetical protein
LIYVELVSFDIFYVLLIMYRCVMRVAPFGSTGSLL